jgi:hypothetical protein
VVGAFGRWREILAGRFAAAGIARGRADELALLVISACEGALILSRAYRDVAPLETVAGEVRDRVQAELARAEKGAA